MYSVHNHSSLKSIPLHVCFPISVPSKDFYIFVSLYIVCVVYCSIYQIIVIIGKSDRLVLIIRYCGGMLSGVRFILSELFVHIQTQVYLTCSYCCVHCLQLSLLVDYRYTLLYSTHSLSRADVWGSAHGLIINSIQC